MRPPRVLALDIGTSSVRATVYDGSLHPASTARARYRWRIAPGGIVEADAERLLRLVAATMDEALQNERRPVDAVGIATFWHSLVGLDSRGNPATPLIPWNDTRAADEAAALRERLDERHVHARTGCRLHPAYWPARLRWFARREPRTFARVRRWASFAEFLEHRWLGRSAVSLCQASGTGLLDQRSAVWDGEILGACRIDADRLSPIVPLASGEGRLNTRLQRRWPLLAGAQWVPSIADGAANNIGAGAVTSRRAALMIGTSGALRVLWTPRDGSRLRVPFGLWRYRLDERRVVVGGALSNGGNVREWVLETLAADPALQRRAEALPPASHGLTMLPFLSGTRSPDYLTHATGTISGVTLATRPEHILRATMEAVAFRFAGILADLDRAVSIREITASGGALDHSRAWVQMLADTFDRPILMSREQELTSRGAAALALEVLGARPLGDAGTGLTRRISPNRARHAIYRAAMERQADLMRRLYGAPQ